MAPALLSAARHRAYSRVRLWGALGVTLLAILLVDFAKHGARLSYPFPETLLVGTLIIVAGSGFVAGIRAGIASALIVSLFAFRFYADGALVSFAPATWISFGLLSVLALATAIVSGYLHTREKKLQDRALRAEREKLSALEKARLELAQKNDDLERANRALAAVNEGLESFAYVVSHDLKEPVRAMTALLEDAEVQAGRPEVRATIHVARTSNERLAKLLTGLLEVARASRVDPSELRAVNIAEVLTSPACETRYALLRAERGARIEATCLLGTPLALATEDHVCQILGNLILNSIRHNDKTSPLVRVTIVPQDAEGRMVEVSVEDDGPGFDPAVVGQIGRVRPGRPAMVRGGFGLVIVRRAVERLGGTVWFGASEDLGGAAVRFTLPAASVAGSAGATRDAEGAAGAAFSQRPLPELGSRAGFPER